MIDPDLGWHLKIGEWISNNKSVPHFDQYSHTMAGFRWVDHEWLVESWFWWMYSNNLWWLVILIFSILTFFPFSVWLKRCKSLASLWIIILAAGLILNFLGVRPQILSFFFFFLVFDILYKKYNWSLPIIFFAWANLHAGFFSGLMLFGLFIATNFLLDCWKTKKPINSISKNYLPIVIFLGSFVVTLINPYGWELYKEIFRVIFSSDTAKYISEWQPALNFFNINSILLIAIILSLFIKYYKRYPVRVFVPALFFLIMYLKSIRMGPLFLVTAIPITILGIDFLKSEILIAQKKKPFSQKQLRLFKIIGISLFIFLFSLIGWALITYRSFILPEKAVAFLKEQAKQEKIQNILNEYGWGGYLIWKAPEIKVFIDGRMPHWIDKHGNSAMKDYIKIFYSWDNKDALKEIFKKHKITTVLIRSENKPGKTSRILNLIPLEVKNYLSGSRFIKQINNFLNKKKATDLRAFLVKNNWEIIYEDEIAVIINKK